MSNYKIARRKFITASGAIFTLPLLESLFPFSKALAQAANDPRRFVLFYFPNGTYNRPDKPIWATQVGALNAGNTSLALSPFSSSYGDLISINKLRNDPWKSLDKIYKDEHASQAAAYFTCATAITSSTTTLEHRIGDKFGKPAFVLCGSTSGANMEPQRYISYRNGKGISGITNPGDLYRSLLSQVVPSSGGGGGTPTPTPTPTAATDNNKSILDSTIADFNAFNKTLGKSDRAKMDEFLTAVRELEGKVVSTAPTTTTPPPPMSTGGACQKPTLDSKLDSTNTKDTALYLPKFYAFNDMIKIAFACDITRSVSIMVDVETSSRTFASAPSELIYQGVDITGGHTSHMGISHEAINTTGYNMCVTRDRVLMTMVIDLVNKLKSSTDPSGSRMLDNTIIQAGYGVEDGNHSYFKSERPLILAGGRNMITGGTSLHLSTNEYRDLYYTVSSLIGAGLSDYQGSTRILKL